MTQLALLCVIAARGARAQEPATLRGFVTDKSTGQPVAAAQITFVEAGRTATTDVKGHFEATGLPAGSAHLAVRAPGFAPLRMAVNLMAAATIERSIELDSTTAAPLAEAQKLPEVEINAPSNPTNYRLVDFERRRLLGRGQYLTETEIVKSGAYNVNDLVKNMRGVLYECGGGAGCHVYMARAPMRCRPEYVVDGQVMNDFGPVTPIRDIIALEVYSGPTEVPGEYAGRFAGCGVVVIWTRSGPTRKQE
jgi:hypothetical protein